MTSLYPVSVTLSSLSPPPPVPNTTLAIFSAMLLLPTMYFLHTGQQLTLGRLRHESQMAWPSLHCQILNKMIYDDCFSDEVSTDCL